MLPTEHAALLSYQSHLQSGKPVSSPVQRQLVHTSTMDAFRKKQAAEMFALKLKYDPDTRFEHWLYEVREA